MAFDIKQDFLKNIFHVYESLAGHLGVPLYLEPPRRETTKLPILLYDYGDYRLLSDMGNIYVGKLERVPVQLETSICLRVNGEAKLQSDTEDSHFFNIFPKFTLWIGGDSILKEAEKYGIGAIPGRDGRMSLSDIGGAGYERNLIYSVVFRGDLIGETKTGDKVKKIGLTNSDTNEHVIVNAPT